MNVIQVPLEHKMFDLEFEGGLSNFIYDEFSLLFTKKNKLSLGVTIFFKSDNGDISGTEIHLVCLNGNWIKDIFYEIKLNEKSENEFDVYCSSFDKKYVNIGFEIAQIVIRTMVYIMNAPRDTLLKPKIPKEIVKTQNKTENKGKSRKVYLLDEIVKYVNDNGLAVSSNETHKINCPCWSVRGHYRHYKSGKVVFINNYKKGIEKDKAEPKNKTYYV